MSTKGHSRMQRNPRNQLPRPESMGVCCSPMSLRPGFFSSLSHLYPSRKWGSCGVVSGLEDDTVGSRHEGHQERFPPPNTLLPASGTWILLTTHKDFPSMMNVWAARVDTSVRREITLLPCKSECGMMGARGRYDASGVVGGSLGLCVLRVGRRLRS